MRFRHYPLLLIQILAVVLLGCTRSGSQPDLQAPAGLPLLPDPRLHASVAGTPQLLTGSQFFSQSGGTVSGTQLVMDSADPGSLAYAIYQFNGTAADVLNYMAYQVSARTVPDSKIYAAIANYETGHWYMVEPRTVDAPEYEFGGPAGRWVSPGGSLYVVLFAYGGEDFTIDNVSIAYEQTVDPGIPIARIEANPVSGTTPLDTTFKVSNSYDTDGSIVLYEIDFDDDGTYDYSNPLPDDVPHTYIEDGAHTCRLRVTDNEAKTATQTCQVVSGLGDMPPGWAGYGLTTMPTMEFADTKLSAVGGKPAVMIRNTADPYEQRYLAATKEEPGLPQDWNSFDVPSGYNGQFFDFTDNNGTPAFAFRPDTDKVLYYVTFDGASWNGHIVDRVTQHTAGEYCHIMMLGDKPVIAYERYHGGIEHLSYARSTVPNPTQTSDWIISELALAHEPNKVTGLIASGGVPIICFGRRNGSTTNVGIAYGITPAPSQASDWVDYEAYTDASQGYGELSMVGGLPAIVVSNASPSPNETRLIRSSTPVPLDASYWTAQVFEATEDSSGWGVGNFGGNPFIIANLSDGGVHFYEASGPDPQFYFDWNNTTLFPNWLVAEITAAEMPFGRPALLARRDQQHNVYYMYKTP